jgi:transposase InsO family protein
MAINKTKLTNFYHGIIQARCDRNIAYQEAVYLHELLDGFQARRVIKDWIGFYNTERPHTALDKQTPNSAYFSAIHINQAA